MEKHFLESHLGGYYFSKSDPEFITCYCDSSGDSDDILFSFDEDDKDEPFKSMARCFTRNLILNKKALESSLLGYNALEIGIKKAVKDIKANVVFDMDMNKDIVKDLLGDGEIDKKTYDGLVDFFNDCIKKQLQFIDEFDYDTIDLKSYENKIQRKKR